MLNNKAPKSNGSVQPFITGLTVGAFIGATLALLYAPKKGKELREDIADTVEDVSSKFRRAIDNVKETVSEIMDEGKVTGNELFQEAVAKAESLIDEADRIIADAKTRNHIS
jgi:gas vesicle protein